MPDASAQKPLVSIFMFVRNGAGSIRRAVDSVLAQTWPNIEFVIQDGASTDATLDILRSYGDSRFKIVSEPDSGPSEALLRALRRCRGEFIGSCLADEELLPDATERAVAALQAEPELGAFTGDAMITDYQGRQTGLWTSAPFNLVEYLMGDYCPYFCSSFFRRSALEDAGLLGSDWNMDCVEFELWCRLAARSPIKYVPGVVSKYAAHPDQSSNKPGDVARHMTGRLNHIASTCSTAGFLGDNPLLRAEFMWGHARRFCEHAILFRRPETANTVHQLVKRTVESYGPVAIDGIPYDEDYASRRHATDTWQRFAAWLPAAWRDRFIASRVAAARRRDAGKLRFAPAPDNRLRARMYDELAERYDAKQRPKEALRIRQSAKVLTGLMSRSQLEDGDNPPMGYTDVPGTRRTRR